MRKKVYFQTKLNEEETSPYIIYTRSARTMQQSTTKYNKISRGVVHKNTGI